MNKLDKFHSPALYAEQKDLNNLPAGQKEAFLAAWNKFVNGSTQTAQVGGPWFLEYDNPRAFYFNPLEGEYPVNNNVPIQWTAFPNRINHFFTENFSTIWGDDASDKLHELADIGPDAFASKYSSNEKFKKIYPNGLTIPAQPCQADSKATKALTPAGPRGWQDEYCEWTVKRNAEGKIIEISITHENPEYWFHLWRINPDRVVALYQEILENPAVALEDLYLLDEHGKPVIERETGRPAYNPINKWNCGPVKTESQGGAVHLTSPPNTIGAEIYLGAAATILREDANGNRISGKNELICAAQYGQIYRNSDPTIGQAVNNLVANGNFEITLTDPIALYGQMPDMNVFSLPASAGKDYEISQFYKVVRGYSQGDKPEELNYYPNDMVLHHKFFVPEGCPFTLSDIKVNGKNIKWGSQVTDAFKVQLSGTGRTAQDKKPLTYPKVEDRKPAYPSINTVLDYNVLEASLYNNLQNLASMNSCVTQVEQDSTVENIAVYCNAANENTKIDLGEDIQILKAEFKTAKDNQGNDIGQLFILSLKVAADAKMGDRPILIYNEADKSQEQKYPFYGMFQVVAPDTLASSVNEQSETLASN